MDFSASCGCGKRVWLTASDARLACRGTGNRLRVYKCPNSNFLHVTDADKDSPHKRTSRQEKAKRRQETRTSRRKWKQNRGA